MSDSSYFVAEFDIIANNIGLPVLKTSKLNTILRLRIDCFDE